MTEEYFRIEEINDDSKFYEECNNNNRGKLAENYSGVNRISQDVRLHQMEEQLEIAENRCNTLKDQLDHMKKLYQNKTDHATNVKPHNRKTVYSSCNPSMRRHSSEFINNFKSPENKSTSSLQKNEKTTAFPIRQNSQAITTDNSGAAVQTINNILNGITDSVNRLSQIHVHIENDRPYSRKKGQLCDSACGDDAPMINIKFSPQTGEHAGELIPVTEESATEGISQFSSTVSNHKSKSAIKKRGKRRNQLNNNGNKNDQQNSTITVNIINKKSLKSTAKHIEKKFKIEPVKMIGKDSTSMLSPKKSRKQVRRTRHKSRASSDRNKAVTQTLTLENEKLVELYHNNAAKGSDTDGSTQDVQKAHSKEEKTNKSSNETIPSLPLEETSDVCLSGQQQKQQDLFYNFNNRRLSPINENAYREPTAPRADCYSSICSKNYELPTIASKMKQVAKCYLKRFNFHSIPFCAAKSTTPSHNIGINIQQVMNIIKTRQPVTGISPTLVHNIGLAAEKLQGSPFTAMMSSLGSRIGYGRSMCPLIKDTLNYQQLQEVAKEIPEQICKDDNQEQITEEEMACGDRNTPMWTIDPINQKNCTCVPQQGIGFQQVLSRYSSNNYSTSTVTQLQYRMRNRQNKFVTRPIKVRTKALSLTKEQPYNKPVENKFSGGLKGKEKNLKEVLTNLHDEFAYINHQYETLSKKVEELGPKASEETLKQLEKMEYCLNNKEEEITMVMKLYKEVMALKQQVKSLKEKASLASLSLNGQQQQYTQQPPRYHNDAHTAVHLTKLLRQIQTYQELNRIGRRN